MGAETVVRSEGQAKVWVRVGDLVRLRGGNAIFSFGGRRDGQLCECCVKPVTVRALMPFTTKRRLHHILMS